MSHEHEYNQKKQLTFCVLTTSDTRNVSNDKGGWTIRQMLENAGHKIFETWICQDDKVEIESIIEEWLRNPNIHGIITTGGTGLGFRDVTPETIEPYFTKKIDGFGELFRMISYTKVYCYVLTTTYCWQTGRSPISIVKKWKTSRPVPGFSSSVSAPVNNKLRATPWLIISNITDAPPSTAHCRDRQDP